MIRESVFGAAAYASSKASIRNHRGCFELTVDGGILAGNRASPARSDK